MRNVLLLLSCLFLVPLAASAPWGDVRAQSSAGFGSYLNGLLVKARQQGVSDATIRLARSSTRYDDSAVSIMNRVSGGGGSRSSTSFPPFTGSDEQRAIIGKAREGRQKYSALNPFLRRALDETGVPPGIILAIYGKESNYGSYTGNFDVLNVTASLAYEGRRRDLFEGEFIAALKMIDRGVPRSRMKGSFAGAMGKPQFLPSVYLHLAQDGNGDGEADIWASEADAVASVANYLHEAGWKRGEPWGVRARVPSGLDRNDIANELTEIRCERVFGRHTQWKTVSEWRALGVIPQGPQPIADDSFATLLEPDGEGRGGYLLTGNYRAILDYNCSNFYALAVGLLADEIE